MDISTKHANAVIAACRIPALNARLALIEQPAPGGLRSKIQFYGTEKPAPGAPPGGDPIVTLTMTAAAGTVDAVLHQIQITTPLEAQVDGADPATGTIPLWARVTDSAGDWWADMTVTVEGGGGEIQLVQTGTEGDPPAPVVRLFNGAFTRISSAVVQG
jgi:hypothetical protein